MLFWIGPALPVRYKDALANSDALAKRSTEKRPGNGANYSGR